MVVECAEGIGGVESVVPGVEGSVEPLVYVECTVEPVLPGVKYEAITGTLAFHVGNLWSCDWSLQSPEQLEGRDEPPINKVDYRRPPRLEKLLGA